MTARRRVQFVLVCEDQQHEAFGRRLLKRMGLVADKYQLRTEVSPYGRGAGDQFVRDTYVAELDAGRRVHVERTLVVIIDGDRYGVSERLRSLNEACGRRGVAKRSSADKVVIFVPTWNIETWLAYLDGEKIDEGLKSYPKLAKPRDCLPHVKELVAMCQRRELRKPAPDSLRAACREYDERFRLTDS